MKTKGFTLIELLAVILILGIISLIAIPTVNKVVSEAKTETAKINVNNYINAIEQKNMSDIEDYVVANKALSISNFTNLDIKGTVPSLGYVVLNDNLIVTDGEFCVNNIYVNFDGTNLNADKDKKCENIIIPSLLLDTLKEKNAIVDNPSSLPGVDIAVNYNNDLIKNNDEYGSTYYFRGKVDNYVFFANILWRIIRINGNDSIRLIADQSVGDGAFNALYSDIKHVGYTYDGIDSTAKDYLEQWYLDSIAINPNFDKLVVETTYCNDTSVYSVSGATTYFGSYGRLNVSGSVSPTFICPGNQNLSYGGKYISKVGLITADEVAFAGGVSKINNLDFYLYNGNYWYTLSPSLWDSSRPRMNYYSNSTNQYLSDISCYYERGIRPVISLSKNTMIYGGVGTKDNPYKIKTN